MIYTDLHMHTVFCDGKDTPRDMVEAAVNKGLKTVGVCAHSYMDFFESWCIKKERVEEFIKEMQSLKTEFKDKIKVLCGLEKDVYSNQSCDGFDYVIGSVHYFNANGVLSSVDESQKAFEDSVKNCFNGDFILAAENYYQAVGEVVEKTNPDIIGHFNLVEKFNDGNRYFDAENPRYVAAWKRAADKLLLTGKPFEINVGGISRGWIKQPYPTQEMYKYLKDRGAKFVLSSDAHTKENVAFQFDKWNGVYTKGE